MRQPKPTPPKPAAAGVGVGGGGEGAAANGAAGATGGGVGEGGEATVAAPTVEGQGGGEGKEGDQGEEKKGGKESTYNRKEKSLGLLCDKSPPPLPTATTALSGTSHSRIPTPCPPPLPHVRSLIPVLCAALCVVHSFLRVYSSGEEKQICLDASAKRLGVERRRIYDIVNILEAVAVVSRRGKNQYDWHGTSLLVDRINRLAEALKESEAETGGALHTGMLEMNKSMMRADTTAETIAAETAASLPDPSGWSSDAVISNLITHNAFVFESPAAPSATPSTTPAASVVAEATIVSPPGMVADPAVAAAAAASKRKKPPAPSGRDARKEQSLGNLSAVFVQMFLANETRIVSLEDAAKWLLKGSIAQEPSAEGAAGEGQEVKQGEGGGDQPKAITETNETEVKEGKEVNETVPAPTESKAEGERGEAKEQASGTFVPPPGLHPAPPPVLVSVSAANASLFPPSAHNLYPLRILQRPKTLQARAASLFKSKVRRLYDIANVFSSLKLIDKIHLIQSRRPAFRWLGADRYPLSSTISADAYTRETVNRDPAALSKRKSSAVKQEQEEAAKRTKKEGEGGGGPGAVVDDKGNAAFPQMLHSSFSAPPGTS